MYILVLPPAALLSIQPECVAARHRHHRAKIGPINIGICDKKSSLISYG